jgi:hypothetical protein
MSQTTLKYLEEKGITKKEMKYCKNCKYIDIIKLCEVNIKIEIDPIGDKVMTGWENPFKKNEYFDCPDYKRKLFKFWVKE